MTMDEVLSGSTIYMSSPLFTKSLPQGKHWLSLDLERADKLGMNFNAYAQQSPADTLEALRKAGSVKKVGEETIDGRPTTHYRATVDYSKIPNGAKVQELTKLKAAPIDVWIGSDRLPRRMRVTYSTNAAGSVVSASMTMDFSNYGEPVHVQVPAANDTIDFTKLGGNP